VRGVLRKFPAVQSGTFLEAGFGRPPVQKPRIRNSVWIVIRINVKPYPK